MDLVFTPTSCTRESYVTAGLKTTMQHNKISFWHLIPGDLHTAESHRRNVLLAHRCPLPLPHNPLPHTTTSSVLAPKTTHTITLITHYPLFFLHFNLLSFNIARVSTLWRREHNLCHHESLYSRDSSEQWIELPRMLLRQVNRVLSSNKRNAGDI